MGAPIPPPEVPPPAPEGFLCSECWGEGKPFGLLTPDRVVIRISGVEKGPTWIPARGLPVNDDFICPQVDSISPCVFQGVIGLAYVNVAWGGGLTNIVAFTSTGYTYLAHVASGVCSTFKSNELTLDFINGSAQVFIPKVLQ